jgi:predicted phosphodiesterase
MRVAIMSDIHGFDLALRAVLDDIDRSGPFDLIAAAGDLCEIGPRPDEVVRIIQQRGIAAVSGNTDVELVEGARTQTETAELRYAIDRLGSAGIAWLAGLPFELRVSPPGGRGPSDDLLIVHANPRNLKEPLDPSLSDDELLRIIGPVEAAMIAFGHIHICYTRRVGPYRLLDVSAVGNPKDGDLRCKWGAATWDGDRCEWSAELHCVPYPLEATEIEIIECGVPSPNKVIRKLKQASYRDR